MTICYDLGGKLYLNLTNRCTNHCDFCVRDEEQGIAEGVDLWLEREPETEEIIDALKKQPLDQYREIVFCGYGEPTIRIHELLETARFLKQNTSAAVRINTNGHANRFHGRDITPDLAGLIDVVSISLNAKNAEKYQKICHCCYGEEGFFEMLDFTKKCTRYVPRVILSVVDVIGEKDIQACAKLAADTGAEFRVREKI